ncbi:MAG: alpha-hydroxy-acid oxidizing protein, partial [Candidatus Odinarchaeia archaeon]
DISGAGGTSWAAVEAIRGKNELGKVFREWGIPTAISLVEVINTVKIPVVSSGGIRTGIDIAKSLALGAKLVSVSLPLLKEASKGLKQLRKYVSNLITELKITMYLVGAQNIKQLMKVPLVIMGKTAAWLKLRGIDINKYTHRN